MPELLSESEWFELLQNERDAFRLSIRGCAALEAQMNAACEELFRSPMPGGMKSLGPFVKRLQVAAAIGVVPAHIIDPLKKLWKLRNDFAHGDLTELTDARMEDVRKAFVQKEVAAEKLPSAFRFFAKPVAGNAVLHLVMVLNLARTTIELATNELRAERDAHQGSALREAIIAQLTKGPAPSELPSA
jgi:hypothetical protein